MLGNTLATIAADAATTGNGSWENEATRKHFYKIFFDTEE